MLFFRGLPHKALALLAMTDKENALCHFTMTAHHCYFERSEKSISSNAAFQAKIRIYLCVKIFGLK